MAKIEELLRELFAFKKAVEQSKIASIEEIEQALRNRRDRMKRFPESVAHIDRSAYEIIEETCKASGHSAKDEKHLMRYWEYLKSM